eukprot:scaffold2248_cov136-Skeletonema_dohrnii-CCMP3373.AAC.3
MDPIAATKAAEVAAPPPLPRRQRRGALYVQQTLLFTTSFVILSLLKLGPLAQNSVHDHNNEIDMPHNRDIDTLQLLPKEDTKCLDLNLNQDMDSLVANARQIFVTMPAKAGGTSMKDFTKLCMKKAVQDNVLSREWLWKDYLVDSLHVQSIIASHLLNDDNFIRLVNFTSRETLMIHTHRDESRRVASAVKQISESICQFMGKEYSKQQQTTTKFNVRKNNTHCILDEGSFVTEISANSAEVGFSTHSLLTCKSYKAIQDNASQLVFVHYKQLDKLQKLLAKHHCPEILGELPIKANVAEEKSLKVLLHKKGTDEARNSVDLEEWLHAKGPAMEWTLKLRRDASCQAKTYHMEDELFACPDETLRVTPAGIDRW